MKAACSFFSCKFNVVVLPVKYFQKFISFLTSVIDFYL